MAGIPDPDNVNSGQTFVAFIRALRASLDQALAMPMTNEWDDWRGGWLNRDLAGFINGMAIGSPQPVDCHFPAKSTRSGKS
jgi:hypothetical protein